MTIAEALFIVTNGVQNFTDSFGSPNDKSRVRAYLAAHGHPTDLHIYFYVSGIPFSHFFAFSDQAFDNAKDNLWAQILSDANIGSLDQPTDWHFDSLLGQLATYLSIHVTSNPSSSAGNTPEISEV